MVALRARPLRFDATRLVMPLALVPGLAMAAAHAPLALLAVAPVVLSSFALSRRERYRLDRCAVHIDGPALELRYQRLRIDALDLRYAARRETTRGDLVLSEGESSYLAFGTDPPDNAHFKGEAGDATGLWRAVRLRPTDLARLRAAVEAVPACAPPRPEDLTSQLQALGSIGVWGPRAEALLVAQLCEGRVGDRLSGPAAALAELSLREDATGAAARRVLGLRPR